MSFKPRQRKPRIKKKRGGGRKAQTCYIFRESRNGALLAFIPHPAGDGSWIRTSATVVAVACPACGAERFEPCRGDHGIWMGPTHADRDRAGKRARKIIYERMGIQHTITIDIEAAKMGECQLGT